MKLLSTVATVLVLASGSAMANDGPAPLTLTELDTVSAGSTYASAYGNSEIYWGRHSVEAYSDTDAEASGNYLEAAEANQYTLIEAAGAGKHVIWHASTGTVSGAAAISYGYGYCGCGGYDLLY